MNNRKPAITCACGLVFQENKQKLFKVTGRKDLTVVDQDVFKSLRLADKRQPEYRTHFKTCPATLAATK